MTKTKAILLFELNLLKDKNIGDFEELSFIHKCLFEDIYDFAGQLRKENISKGSFRFVPVMYLKQAVDIISKMPKKPLIK